MACRTGRRGSGAIPPSTSFTEPELCNGSPAATTVTPVQVAREPSSRRAADGISTGRTSVPPVSSTPSSPTEPPSAAASGRSRVPRPDTFHRTVPRDAVGRSAPVSPIAFASAPAAACPSTSNANARVESSAKRPPAVNVPPGRDPRAPDTSAVPSAIRASASTASSSAGFDPWRMPAWRTVIMPSRSGNTPGPSDPRTVRSTPSSPQMSASMARRSESGREVIRRERSTRSPVNARSSCRRGLRTESTLPATCSESPLIVVCPSEISTHRISGPATATIRVSIRSPRAPVSQAGGYANRRLSTAEVRSSARRPSDSRRTEPATRRPSAWTDRPRVTSR